MDGLCVLEGCSARGWVEKGIGECEENRIDLLQMWGKGEKEGGITEWERHWYL